MSDHRRPTEVRRVELIDAALHIIATRGITALSTRTLATCVGLSTGALFRHFPTLDALLEGVVGRVETVLESTYPPADLPPAERLALFVEARSTAVGERLGILRLLQSEQFRLALPNDGSARLAACVRRSRRFLTECLEEGQSTGSFRTDVSAQALTMIVVGTVQALAQAALPGPSPLPSPGPSPGPSPEPSPEQNTGPDAADVRQALTILLRPPSGNPKA